MQVVNKEVEDMLKLGVAPRVLRQRETHPSRDRLRYRRKASHPEVRSVLVRRSFVLETDHQPLQPLQYLQSAKLTNGRLMRGTMLLQPFVFSVRVIPGADFLSRVVE